MCCGLPSLAPASVGSQKSNARITTHLAFYSTIVHNVQLALVFPKRQILREVVDKIVNDK